MNKLIPILLLSVLVAGCTATPIAPPPASTTPQPASVSTSTAPAAVPANPSATPAPTRVDPPVPPPRGQRALVQFTDGHVALVDAAGHEMPLGRPAVRLSGLPFAATVAGDRVFGLSTGTPPVAFGVSPSVAQPVSGVGPYPTGAAAWQDGSGKVQVAWGVYTTTAAGMTHANLLAGGPDGSSLRPVLTDTTSGIPSILLPLRWSASGETLYYSSEPSGMGGYMPFGGFSGLYSMDIASSLTHTLVPRASLGVMCLDDLSADFAKLAYHCGDQAIHVRDLATGQTTTIDRPAGAQDAAALGAAVFNPAGTRVAYALARRDPEHEQGWLAVSSGLTGGSELIYTSVTGAYVRAAGWLDEDTLVFQLAPAGGQSGQAATVWAISLDGSRLRQLAEGDLLAVVAGDEPASQALRMKRYENREVNLAFAIPADWEVPAPDHNAAGIQIIMGPPPISWTSPVPPALQVSIADGGPTAIVDELAMLCGDRCSTPPKPEAIILRSGLTVQRAAVPGQTFDAPEAHTVWYIVAFGPKVVFMSMDSARANLSWETLLGTFSTLDGTRPAGESLDGLAWSPVEMGVFPSQGPRGTAFGFTLTGTAGQQVLVQIVSPEQRTVVSATVTLDSSGHWTSAGTSPLSPLNPFTPGHADPTGFYRAQAAAIGGPLIGEALFEVTK